MTATCIVPSSNRRQLTNFLGNIDPQRLCRYRDYWRHLTNRSPRAVYNAYLFTFMSVHTTWRSNVKGFLAVRDLPLDCSVSTLHTAIRQSGVGLTQLRTAGIWRFRQSFWVNPQEWCVDPGPVERNELVRRLHGLGMAKTSFALEMCYPETAQVTCLDTHILRLCGWPRKDAPSPREYQAMERVWLEGCQRYGVPSPLARHIYWDDLQGKADTRYWSFVLEEVRDG